MSPLTVAAAATFLQLALGPGVAAAGAALEPEAFQSTPGIERTIERMTPEVRFGFSCPIWEMEWAGPCKWRVRWRPDQPIALDPTIPVGAGRMTDRFAAGPSL